MIFYIRILKASLGQSVRFNLRSTILLGLVVSLLAGCNLPGFAPAAATGEKPTAPGQQTTIQPSKVLPSPFIRRFTSTPNFNVIPTQPSAVIPTRTPTATPFPPVTVETVSLFSKFMSGMERVASVYLPGEYANFPDRRYKVLYAFDGQQLPEIAFEQYLNSLTSSHQIEPFIVVAVESTEGDQRQEELGAGPYINVFGWGTRSDDFNNFLVSEMIPKINNQYRTLTGPQNTGVMGWSLGGLTAFYLAWMYPKVFGIVGAFSPSFWWRLKSEPGFELQSRVIFQLVRDAKIRPGLRMWFEAGTNEEPYSDIDKNGVPDMIQDIQDILDLLEQKGYRIGEDIFYIEVKGGEHLLTTWAKVLPDFLHFAFPYTEP